MNNQSEHQKTRLITSYFSVTLSIALVIFILGIFGILIINSRKIESHFKEQISFTIYINELTKTIAKKFKIKKRNKKCKIHFKGKGC